MTKEVAKLVETEIAERSAQEASIGDRPDSSKICANCGSTLNGQFCHSCGQSSKSMIKFFGDVAKELLDDALGYDSRLKHSIFPLLFKPGRITLDYIKGKRFHYVLPFKLYLITSVLFILLIKNVVNTDIIKFSGDSDNVSTQQNSAVLEGNYVQAIEELEGLKKPTNNTDEAQIKEAFTNEVSLVKGTDAIFISEQVSNEIVKDFDDEVKIKSDFNFCGEDQSVIIKWDNTAKRFDGLDALDDGICKMFMKTINPKLKGWFESPQQLIDAIIELLPYMMFIILPIFAIFLKVFYVFSKRYYTEHLVFLLHNHSFIFMIIMLQIIFDSFEEQLRPIKHWSAQATESTLSFFSLILGVWMLVYVFLAMKRFYRQGWGATIFKTIFLGCIYVVMLSIGFVMALAVGAYKA